MQVKTYRLSSDTRRKFGAWASFAWFAVYASIAITLYTYPDMTVSASESILRILVILSGLSKITEGIMGKKENRIGAILSGGFDCALIVWVAIRDTYLISVLPLALGIYLLLMAAAHFTSFFLLRHVDEKKARVTWRLLLGVASVLLGIMLLFSVERRAQIFIIIATLYFWMTSITALLEFFDKLTPETRKLKDKVKRRVRITLPAGIVALIPYRAISKFNEKMRVNSEESPKLGKFSSTPDIEIFIHVTTKGLGRVGHIDICYNDNVMTFGSYDAESYRLKGLIGQGVLAIVKGKKKYVDFCISHSNKSIFAYGLSLSGEQKERLEKRIASIMDDVDVWKSPMERTKNSDCSDYASLLVQNLDAKLYKFNKGRFRVYFVAGTNCALLADRVLGVLGTDLLSFNGILTPGSYYSYLERQFIAEGTFVVTKELYKAEVNAQSSITI